MPPPPPGAPAVHPVLALSAPGALAAVLEEAGLRVVAEGETAVPFVFPNAEVAWRANASAGPNQLAIAHSGEDGGPPSSPPPTALTPGRMGASATTTSSSGRRASAHNDARARMRSGVRS